SRPHAFPGCPVYPPPPPPPISGRDEEGFSSCSTCPGHRAAAPTPPEGTVAPASVRRVLLPSRSSQPLGLRGSSVSGLPLRSLSLRPGDSLTLLPRALSMGSRASVSLCPAIQATGLLALAPAGLPPAKHVSITLDTREL